MQGLTDRERYPLMTPESERYLTGLRQHPHAPKWNHACGDRLTADGLARVRDFERQLLGFGSALAASPPPEWVYAFAETCLGAVPHYRSLGVGGAPRTAADFAAIPTTTRETLASTPWRLVPDEAALDDLIVYDTSGRTGHAIVVPTHPTVSSMYLPLLRAVLATRGLTLDGGPGRVAIVNACLQRRTFAFASVSAFLGWAGFAKINLRPTEWRSPDDRVRFLDDCRPEIYTGDPLSFVALAELPLATRPKALISTSMAMPDDVRAAIETRFGCPVIDLYSLTESGPVAVLTADGYRLLRHDLYVEIVRGDGTPCAEGEVGEIVLTGGANPFFPLLRYRTGDRAALVTRRGAPHLVDLDGRPAMVFRDGQGEVLNNVDIAAVLRPLRLARHTVHQSADGSVLFWTSDRAAAEPARAAVGSLFGVDVTIAVADPDGAADGPAARCSSELMLEPPRRPR